MVCLADKRLVYTCLSQSARSKSADTKGLDTRNSKSLSVRGDLH